MAKLSLYVLTGAMSFLSIEQFKTEEFELWRSDVHDLDDYSARSLGLPYKYSVTEEEYRELFHILREKKGDSWFPRVDSETGEGMSEGWYINDEYYATKEQADRVAQEAGYENFDDMFDEDEDNYWTDWRDELEQYYPAIEVFEQVEGCTLSRYY